MKTTKPLAGAIAALLLIGTAHAQTTATTTTVPVETTTTMHEGVGVRGKTFAELNYSWVDFSRDRDVDADGFIAGFDTNTPVAPGIDFGLGYSYFRENGHRNPFTNSDFDARYHQLNASSTWYFPSGGFTPFLTGGVGYQWSRGDFQRLRTYDDMWLWNLGLGAEIPLGRFAVTPHVLYSDGFDDDATGTWHYGVEANTWFTDKIGGFVDATFHEARGGYRADAWTYTAGVRFRF